MAPYSGAMLAIVARSARRHAGQPVAEKLDKLADHALLAEDLGDRQHEVGGGGPRSEPAGQFEAHDFRHQQRERLAEHHRLCLDAADAPADHAQAVDHCGVAVGAHQRVGHSNRQPAVGRLPQKHAASQKLEIHLVHDADCRRHHTEVVEGLLAPAEEGIPLGVAAKLEIDVLLEGLMGAEEIDLHRVVDHEIHRHQWVDLLGITAEPLHRGPHGRQVDDAGHTGEVLQHDPGWLEGNLGSGRGSGVPGRKRPNVRLGDGIAIARPQQGLENRPQAVGQPGGGGHASIVEGPQAVVDRLSGAGLEGVFRGKRIKRGVGR